MSDGKRYDIRYASRDGIPVAVMEDVLLAILAKLEEIRKEIKDARVDRSE